MIEMHGFKWMEGSRGDDYILRESSYRCLFPPKNTTSLCPEDTWLDVGAHFGSFAIRISPYVKSVIAIEPAPSNLLQLMQNRDINGIQNIRATQAAVVGDLSGPVNLALGKTFDYTHRVGRIRGRENLTVPGVNINELVKAYEVNKIKIDAEGSEEEILGALDYAPIQELIFEWHFTLIPDPTWSKLRFRLGRLEAEGFEVLKAPEDMSKVTKRWTAIIWARRK